MAVRIRLRRIGKKKQPQYRLVVAESAGPRDGRFIENIGQYNPRVDPAAISVNEERALHWLQHGAQPSETARSILAKAGVWEKFTGEPLSASHAPASEPPVGAQDESASVEPAAAEADVAEPAVAEPAVAEPTEDEPTAEEAETATETEEKAGESADEDPA